MRSRTVRTAAALAGAALLLGACGGDEESITVGSFNFGESQILGNVYGLALEDAGYAVDYQLDLGTREVIFSQLESGEIDLLPEYVGSALGVGFGGEPTGDLDATLQALSAELAEIGVQALEPAPGQDQNAFVVSGDFAAENGLESIADLAALDEVVFAGPSECEDRSTCLLGLTETYGLDNVTFEDIPEGSVRIASLNEGQVDMILLFSTQPVIKQQGFVSLLDPEGIVPVENIVPVVSEATVEEFGQELVDLLNAVSERVTTEALIDMNGRFELDAEDARDVARDFLVAEGLIEG